MLYQTLVAAWPLDLAADDARRALAPIASGSPPGSRRRCARPSGTSGWAAPNEEYESAAAGLAGRRASTRTRPGRRAEIAAFAARIAPAGAVNSLTQTLLRLTSPGVPDLYQGTEFWDFSLVDPDNRRPVDYAARAAPRSTAGKAPPARCSAHWRDGRVKQAIIARALAFRAARAGPVHARRYMPLRVEGPARTTFSPSLRVHEGPRRDRGRHPAARDAAVGARTSRWSQPRRGTEPRCCCRVTLSARTVRECARQSGPELGACRPRIPVGDVAGSAARGAAGGPMNRLVVVSNRVPAPSAAGAQAGGLAVALEALMEQRGGLWFGWSGRIVRRRRRQRRKPARRRPVSTMRPST